MEIVCELPVQSIVSVYCAEIVMWIAFHSLSLFCGDYPVNYIPSPVYCVEIVLWITFHSLSLLCACELHSIVCLLYILEVVLWITIHSLFIVWRLSCGLHSIVCLLYTDFHVNYIFNFYFCVWGMGILYKTFQK